MRKPHIITIATLALSMFCYSLFTINQSFAGDGPSFRCNGRLTKNERLICNNPSLSSLDRQMVSTFYDLTSILNRSAANIVRSNQGYWLKSRQRCGYNYTCTSDSIESRLEDLKSQLQVEQGYRSGHND